MRINKYRVWYIVEIYNNLYHEERFNNYAQAEKVADDYSAVAIWHCGLLCNQYVPKRKRNNTITSIKHNLPRKEYCSKWD